MYLKFKKLTQNTILLLVQRQICTKVKMDRKDIDQYISQRGSMKGTIKKRGAWTNHHVL